MEACSARGVEDGRLGSRVARTWVLHGLAQGLKIEAHVELVSEILGY